MPAQIIKKDRSLKVFHGESAAAGMENAGDAYQAASLIASGASAQNVAMSSAVIHMVASLLYFKVPAVIEKTGSRRKAVILLGFFDAITWVPLVIIALFIGPINPNWLILFWVINLIPALLAAPIRDNLLIDIIPTSGMGRYLSIRSAISNAAYLVTFFIMGRMLDAYESTAFMGFSFVFIMAFIGAMGCFSLYFLVKEPTNSSRQEMNLKIRDFITEAKTKSIGKFILFCALVWFSVELSTPFFSVYILTDLKFSYTQYTSLLMASYLARIISVTFWGKYSDKLGNFKVITIVTPLIFVYRLLMLTSANIYLLLIIQLFNGVMWAGFDLCSYNLIYKAAPSEKRLQYTIFHRALMTLAMSLGALAGMGFINIIPAIRGYNILSLFLLSGIVGFVIIALVFPKLKELKDIPQKQTEAGSTADSWLSPVSAGLLRSGLYHTPWAWAQFRNNFNSNTEKDAPSILPAEQGLLHRPQAWKLFSSPLGIPIPITTNPKTDIAATRMPIVNKPELWTGFTSKSTPDKVTSRNKKNKNGASRDGLFHKPEIWMKYNGQTIATRSAGKAGKIVQIREALYNNSRAWGGFSNKAETSKPGLSQTRHKSSSNKQGLFNKPSEWDNFNKNYDSITHTSANSRMKNANSRQGRLNKPQTWAYYNNPADITRHTVDHSRKNMPVSRKTMFYKPQTWTSFGSK